jgi:hypothetical protein
LREIGQRHAAKFCASFLFRQPLPRRTLKGSFGNARPRKIVVVLFGSRVGRILWMNRNWGWLEAGRVLRTSRAPDGARNTLNPPNESLVWHGSSGGR